MSALTSISLSVGDVPSDAWPALPTETDIYLLPDGCVVIVDMPVELADLAAGLGAGEPCAVTLPQTDGEQSSS